MANILVAPENFAAAQWARVGNTAVVVGNEYTAPDGTTTADKIVDDNGGGQGFVGVQQAGVNIALATIHNLSVFVLPDGNDWIYADLTGMGASNKFAYFNVTGDAVGSVGAAVSDTKIETMPENFKRISMTFLSDAADGSGAVRFLHAETDGDQTVNRDGGSALALWGAYLNAGAEAETYVSQAGITVISGRAPPYIAITRRTADQMNVKQRMAAPKKTMRDL